MANGCSVRYDWVSRLNIFGPSTTILDKMQVHRSCTDSSPYYQPASPVLWSFIYEYRGYFQYSFLPWIHRVSQSSVSHSRLNRDLSVKTHVASNLYIQYTTIFGRHGILRSKETQHLLACIEVTVMKPIKDCSALHPTSCFQ